MNVLFKNRHWIALLVIAFSMLGCNSQMTYQEFLIRFRAECPVYYLIKDLTHQSASDVCACMLKTTQHNYPDMTSLLAGIRALDREPRGESDFVPSAIRMAATTCIKPK